MESVGPDVLKLVQIIWINIILSGDNAVVIAMACRGLPADKQRGRHDPGAVVAVALRIVFTILVATLLATAISQDHRRMPAALDRGQAL